jgi:hypothetical protein
VVASNILVVVPMLLFPVNPDMISENYMGLQIEHRPEFSIDSSQMILNLTLIHNNEKPFTTILAENNKAYFAFYTADCSMSLNCIPYVERTYILRRVIPTPKVSSFKSRQSTLTDSVKKRLPDFVEKNLEWKIDILTQVVIKLRDENEFLRRAKDSEDIFEMGYGIFYEVYRYII